MTTLLSKLQSLFDEHKGDAEQARLASLADRKRRAFAWFNKKLLPRLPAMLEAEARKGRSFLTLCTWRDEDVPAEFQFDLSYPPSESPLYQFCKAHNIRVTQHMLGRGVHGWNLHFSPRP